MPVQKPKSACELVGSLSSDPVGDVTATLFSSKMLDKKRCRDWQHHWGAVNNERQTCAGVTPRRPAILPRTPPGSVSLPPRATEPGHEPDPFPLAVLSSTGSHSRSTRFVAQFWTVAMGVNSRIALIAPTLTSESPIAVDLPFREAQEHADRLLPGHIRVERRWVDRGRSAPAAASAGSRWPRCLAHSGR